MTVESIELYPTCDVHLLLHGPDGATTYQLQVRDYATPTDIRSAQVDHIAYTDFDAAIADVSATGLITPKGIGETFIRIRHTDPLGATPEQTFVSELIVRVRVHDRIASLWCGNNRATIVNGQTNYVLSVYARFDDGVIGDNGTIGDVTGHPYLRCKSSDVAKVDVGSAEDAIPDPGRLQGFGVTGATPVTVTVSVGALSDTVPVFVEPSLDTPRRLLERVHGAGPVGDRRNILIVADGFTAEQRNLFRRLVVLLKDELFSARLHSPYDMLKDRFSVWTLFDPSPEEGTTCADFVKVFGDPVFGLRKAMCIADIDKDPGNGSYTLRQLVRRVGLPDRYRPAPTSRPAAEAAWKSTVAGTDFDPTKLDDDVIARWLKLDPYHIMQARDNRFGMLNGFRYGDRESISVDPANKIRVMEWYELPQPTRAPLLDRRRAGQDWNMQAFVSQYLGATVPVRGGAANTSEVWIGDGADRGFVVFLVNSALDGGVNAGNGIAVSTRQASWFTQVQVNADEVDHFLPDIEVLGSLPALNGSSLDSIVAVMAHEMAHAFDLGDEYEGGTETESHQAMSETDIAERQTIEGYNNLTHHFVIAARAGEPGIINVKRAKWHLWHRMQRASVLTNDPDLLGGGRMRIRLPPEDREKWDRADMHNIEVYLRSRTINGDVLLLPDSDEPDVPGLRWSLEGPLKILQIDPDGSYVLASTFSDEFERGDVLYTPEMHDGKPLTVFHPNVLFALQIFGEPFAHKSDASQANEDPAYPPLYALVPDFDPRHPAFVVGLYDGGGSYNSRVYRPSGTCKLRQSGRDDIADRQVTVDPNLGRVVGPFKLTTQFVPFCYVCRYTLVNALDPKLLPDLDYPV